MNFMNHVSFDSQLFFDLTFFNKVIKKHFEDNGWEMPKNTKWEVNFCHKEVELVLRDEQKVRVVSIILTRSGYEIQS